MVPVPEPSLIKPRSVELQYVFQKEEKEVRIEKKNITKANITTNSQYFIWYQFWG